MLTFRGPDGVDVERPSQELLRRWVVDGDPRDWDSGVGALLERRDAGGEALLILHRQVEGVLVEHHDLTGGRQRYLALPPGPAQGWVELYDSQETWRVARRFFVPAELAWAAVDAFTGTGAAAPEDLRWETQLEMG